MWYHNMPYHAILHYVRGQSSLRCYHMTYCVMSDCCLLWQIKRYSTAVFEQIRLCYIMLQLVVLYWCIVVRCVMNWDVKWCCCGAAWWLVLCYVLLQCTIPYQFIIYDATYNHRIMHCGVICSMLCIVSYSVCLPYAILCCCFHSLSLILYAILYVVTCYITKYNGDVMYRAQLQHIIFEPTSSCWIMV